MWHPITWSISGHHLLCFRERAVRKDHQWESGVSHLNRHLGHKDRREDVVGQRKEDPFLSNQKSRNTWLS